MKKIKKVGNIVAVCLFSCGIFGFIIFLGCRSNPHFAMPIGSVNSVFVDKKGLIYVGCTDAARVQVFDKGKKVSIKRAEADGYSKIQFKAPIFPLSFSICGVVFWLGVMIFVFVNQETIARLMPEE